MNESNLKPEKITKPIQLLAVWFSGLVILVGLLLTAAKTIINPPWITPILVISAILIIPLFLYFVFLMQTKYRPQMQDDPFYSKYLDHNTNQIVNINNEQIGNSDISELKKSFYEFSIESKSKIEELQSLLKNSQSNANIIELTSQLTKEADEIRDKAIKSIDIEINKLLNKYNLLHSALIQHGYENIQFFKNDKAGTPIKFLISVGKDIEPYSLLKVLELIITIQDNILLNYIGEEGMVAERRKNQIVIGSYAYDDKERTNHEVNNDLLIVLKNLKTKTQLKELLK